MGPEWKIYRVDAIPDAHCPTCNIMYWLGYSGNNKKPTY